MKAIKMSTLKQRAVTALVLAFSLAFFLFAVPPVLFSLIIMLPIVLAGCEWCNLAEIESKVGKFVLMLTLICLILFIFFKLDVSGNFDRELSYQICLYSLGLWAVILLWIQGYPSSQILWAKTPIILGLGFILLTTTWTAFTAIVLYDNGRWLLLLAILIVALSDIGGYFAGNLFGRHKLAAMVSPGKTWEGFLGGLFLQGLLILVIKLMLPELSAIDLAILIIPVALSSVVGDLFESMLKRHSGVKDSSSLLPGHGGILDRIDGLMAALPIYWVLLFQGKVF